ncbi:hypothetical protein N8Z93_06125 [Amylibacter sp.]|nr:hypothetical protein [Amylibacter sp.]
MQSGPDQCLSQVVFGPDLGEPKSAQEKDHDHLRFGEIRSTVC